MTTKAPRVFLDTSALFSAVFSEHGGARESLRLGEVGLCQLLVSPEVLAELERNMQAKARRRVADAALLLDRCRVEVTTPPAQSVVQQCQNVLGYAADAVVFAAALDARVDYFVTLDRRHFLENSVLRKAISIPLGTPGDCLAWFRTRRLP